MLSWFCIRPDEGEKKKKLTKISDTFEKVHVATDSGLALSFYATLRCSIGLTILGDHDLVFLLSQVLWLLPLMGKRVFSLPAAWRGLDLP